MENLWQDLRFGVRTLLRNRLTSLLALLILTLGIGANTAIFSVISGVLLTPLPFPHPEALVKLTDSAPRHGVARFSSSPPNFLDWRQQNRSFSTLDAWSSNRVNLTGGARPESVRATAVTGTFFRTLDVQPLRGRFLRPEDDRPGAESVVVLSQDLWQRRFGADPALVGRRVQVDGRFRTVVGIAGPGLRFPEGAELWTPLALDYAKESRGGHYLEVIGRLRPGVGLHQAQADLSAVATRLERLYPASNTAWGVLVEPLQEELVAEVRPALVLLGRAVWVVLLIACANVANLLLARMSSRGREIGVRAALGAGRARLVRQVLAESVVLFLAGGLLGLLVAAAGTRLLLAMNPASLPGGAGGPATTAHIGLDVRVVLYALGISLLTGLAVGLVPALSATGSHLYGALKEGGRAIAGGGRSRLLRQGLVVAEVALALVLLIAAGLLLHSFARLQSVQPGFEPRGVMTAVLSLPDAKYPDAARQAQLYAALLEKAGAVPGVEQVAAVYPLPLSGSGFIEQYRIAGRPEPPPTEVPRADIQCVTPAYFRVLGIPLLAGRAFAPTDRVDGEWVVIVNRTLARHVWPGESPLGKSITFGDPRDPKARWRTVVGVAADVRTRALHREPPSEVYVPLLQDPPSEAVLVVRSAARPGPLVEPLRQAVMAVDRDLPLDRVQTLEAVIAGSLAENRVKTLLIGFFGAFALLLAAVGIYGLVSYSVVQRTHEIGIRVALGAASGTVMSMVLRQGMALVGLGLAAGLAASTATVRLVADQLYEVSALDPIVFIAVPLILAMVALVANWVPARRATRIDPLEALRAE